MPATAPPQERRQLEPKAPNEAGLRGVGDPAEDAGAPAYRSDQICPEEVRRNSAV